MIRSFLRIQHQGLERRATLVAPASASAATPLVVVLHGGGSHPEGVEWESRFSEVAERRGFAVLYPAGTALRRMPRAGKFSWNDGRPYQDGTFSRADDVGFIAALLESGQFAYDPRRCYVAGYSNGAQLAYRLAQQLPERFAAVAAVAGQRGPREFIEARRPIAVMQFSGKRDRIAPYEGGGPTVLMPEFQTDLLPVRTAIAQWARFNGCGEPVETAIGRAVRSVFTSPRGADVVLWTLRDGGHTWPGGNAELPLLGPVNQDVFAADEMAKWFLEKRLP